MSKTLHFLQNRNSSPKLCDPAPTGEELREIIQAAIRVPDHAWLRPWRFLAIAGERRHALGDILAASLLRRDPRADDAARSKAHNAPMRAPLVVVVIARLQEHSKVPALEQRLSAGCAAHAILLAAQAMGYAGVWRTGDAAFDREVMTDLSLAQNEEIIGFLYLGSRDGTTKSIPELNPDHFLSDW
jgi:nitroreductase